MPGQNALTPAGPRALARADSPAQDTSPAPVHMTWDGNVSELNEDSPRFVAAIGETVAIKVAATGRNPEKGRVFQVTLFHLDFSKIGVDTDELTDEKDVKKTVDTHLYLAEVDPGMPVPAPALRTHGLRPTDLVGAPRFGEIAAEVRDFIGDLPLVGGPTLESDRAILSAELRRAGVDTIDRNPCAKVYHHRLDVDRKMASDLADDVRETAAGAKGASESLKKMADTFEEGGILTDRRFDSRAEQLRQTASFLVDKASQATEEVERLVDKVDRRGRRDPQTVRLRWTAPALAAQAGHQGPRRPGHGRLQPRPPVWDSNVSELSEDSPRFVAAIDEAVAIKVATTGPDPGKDRIFQVTLFRLDFSGISLGTAELRENERVDKTVETSLYQTVVNPGMPVPEETLITHGLWQADLEDAPRFGEIAHEVRVFIGNLPLADGPTLERDRAFLSAELKRAGVDPIDRNPCTTAYHHRLDAYGEMAAEFADYMEKTAKEVHEATKEADRLTGKTDKVESGQNIGCLVLVIGIVFLLFALR